MEFACRIYYHYKIDKKNNRVDTTDPDAVKFDTFLDRLRDGENTKEDYNILREKCSIFAMGVEAWKSKGFNDDDVTHLYFTNKQVNNHNNEMIQKIGNPIALIEATNEGRASSFSDNDLGGLASKLYLCVGALIFLTKNFLNLGLCNGSQVIVKEITCEDGETAPSVPKFALVDFGDSRTGEPFFPTDPSKKGGFQCVRSKILHAQQIERRQMDLKSTHAHRCH